MTPDERAAKKKAKKQRQKANKNKANEIGARGVVGAVISGSGGAKVRASKSQLPAQSRLEQTISMSPQFSGMLAPPESRPELKYK